MRQQLFHHLDQLATDRWARQGLRTVLRAAWLAACVWCIGLGGNLVWGWPLRFDMLAIISLGLLGAGVILLLRPKMSPQDVARRLDRRFHLDEQLSTAVEMARTPAERESISAYLLHESASTAALVRRRVARRQAAPWSEIIALAALAVVVVGLLILIGIGRPDTSLIGAAEEPLPGLVDPAQEQLAEEPFTPPDGGPQANGPGPAEQAGQPSAAGDPQVLGPLADALRDQGATRPAADALDSGDLPGAAAALRELADQAQGLSEEARGDLAENLRDAADQIEGRNSEFADQLRESADGLENGGEEASQALEDLAGAIEDLQPNQPPGGQQAEQGQQGEQGQGQQGQQGEQGQTAQGEQGQSGAQGAGGGSGDQPGGEGRQSAPSSRLGVEGEPLSLEAEGEGQNAEPGTTQPPSSAEVVPGRTSGGGTSTVGTTGADPLRVPVDERDVVQDYFTP